MEGQREEKVIDIEKQRRKESRKEEKMKKTIIRKRENGDGDGGKKTKENGIRAQGWRRGTHVILNNPLIGNS